MVFIIEVANPKRIVVRSKEEYLDFINKHSGISNLYRSVYQFKYMKTPFKPDYNSAILDKMFFDFDSKDSLKHVIKFHKYLSDKDLKHYMVQSSFMRFHVYVLCKGVVDNKKASLMSSMVHLTNENKFSYGQGADADVDKATFGDLARITAIPGTYKPKRKCYSSFISSDDLFNPDKLKEKSKSGTGRKLYYGTKLFDLTEFNCTEAFCNSNINFEIEEFKAKFNDKHVDILPPFIKKILANYKEYGNWENRFRFTLYCRDFGYPSNLTGKIAEKYFGKVKRNDNHNTNYDHYRIHKILERVYDSDSSIERYKFPDWDILQAEGYDIENEDIKSIRDLYF